MSTLSDCQFRELSADNRNHFRKLLALFAEAFEAPETYASDPPQDTYLEEFLDRDHVIALAAISNDQVVGGLVAYELEKFEKERSEFYIYDLAVTETHRRRGIATGLIDQLKAIAADRGAYVIFVQADLGDDPAISLYSKLGKREDVLHFDIDVPEKP